MAEGKIIKGRLFSVVAVCLWSHCLCFHVSMFARSTQLKRRAYVLFWILIFCMGCYCAQETRSGNHHECNNSSSSMVPLMIFSTFKEEIFGWKKCNSIANDDNFIIIIITESELYWSQDIVLIHYTMNWLKQVILSGTGLYRSCCRLSNCVKMWLFFGGGRCVHQCWLN